MQTSLLIRLGLFHVSRTFDYMLQLFKKLKQYTKLGLETVHQVLTSKFVCDICRLPSPKKSFYDQNLILNCCFIFKINIRGHSSIAHISLVTIFPTLKKLLKNFKKTLNKVMCLHCQWSCPSKFWSLLLKVFF